MKNLILGVVVIGALIAGGVGGTFAGFVDTEVSENNYYQAGIMDLLVNGKNDPVGFKLQFSHGIPCVSQDFWIDVFNWGECQGAKLYMHYKDVDSVEAGTKLHDSIEYVYDGVATGPPKGYREATGVEPDGANVWSCEPEKISEVGDGMVGQIYIRADDKNLLGEDYASGISEHLDVTTYVYIKDGALVDIDDDHDGEISAAEKTAHDGEAVLIADLTGKLDTIKCDKIYLGTLATQQYGWIHVDVHLQQITAYETDPATGLFKDPDTPENFPWLEPQRKYWPTNALMGDKATWAMLFELNTD